MTEYELIDAINGVMSNALASQALFITVLSAYVVMAYTAGRQLTTFQVGFISFVYVVFSLTISISWADMVLELRTASVLLDDVRGGSLGLDNESVVAPVAGLIIGIRAVMVMGALGFMWSVRHPKAE